MNTSIARQLIVASRQIGFQFVAGAGSRGKHAPSLYETALADYGEDLLVEDLKVEFGDIAENYRDLIKASFLEGAQLASKYKEQKGRG